MNKTNKKRLGVEFSSSDGPELQEGLLNKFIRLKCSVFLHNLIHQYMHVDGSSKHTKVYLTEFPFGLQPPFRHTKPRSFATLSQPMKIDGITPG